MNKKLCADISKRLVKTKKTLAVAESVTAGNIQAALSLAPNAIQFFHGGLVAYNLGQKARQLDIEPIEADASNCVSQKVASTMAINICRRFLSDYGLAITGYASVIPEQDINDLFAYVSIARGSKIVLAKKLNAPKKDHEDVQLFYTHQALKLLATVL